MALRLNCLDLAQATGRFLLFPPLVRRSKSRNSRNVRDEGKGVPVKLDRVTRMSKQETPSG